MWIGCWKRWLEACGGYCWASTGGGCGGGSAWAERRSLGARSCGSHSVEFSEYR